MKKKDDKLQNNIFLNSLRDSGDETNSPSPKLKEITSMDINVVAFKTFDGLSGSVSPNI